jgi:putative hydrolase of the HAD superfamily
MIDKKFKAVFWDFGGVITSSPFQAFSSFEIENNLPKDFIRKVNSTNPTEMHGQN